MASSLRANAYSYLRQQIMSGRLTPGMRLVDNTLAREIGVSRTPVREAISQLEREGLAVCPSGSGAFVKLMNGRELRELFQLRVALETHLVRVATPLLTSADFDALDETCRQLRECAAEARDTSTTGPELVFGARPSDANLTFHLTFVRVAGNQRMSKLLSDVWLMSRTAKDFYLAQSGHVSRHSIGSQLAWTWLDHVRVLRAARRRNADLAASLMGTHIMRFAQRSLHGYDAWAEQYQAGRASNGQSSTTRWLVSGDLDQPAFAAGSKQKAS